MRWWARLVAAIANADGDGDGAAAHPSLDGGPSDVGTLLDRIEGQLADPAVAVGILDDGSLALADPHVAQGRPAVAIALWELSLGLHMTFKGFRATSSDVDTLPSSTPQRRSPPPDRSPPTSGRTGWIGRTVPGTIRQLIRVRVRW